MTATPWALGCVAAVAALTLVTPRVAAQPTEAVPEAPGGGREVARRHFELAKAAVEAGRFRDAAEHFELAYDAAPNPAVLYNLGQARATLGDYAEATVALTRYLHEGGASVPPARRAAVNRDLERLRRELTALEVRSDPSGATVAVDGREVGRTPLTPPVLVTAGRRRIEVRAPAHAPVHLQMDLPRDGEYALSLTLSPIVSAPELVALRLECPLPEARVILDGARPQVMLEPFLMTPVEPGRHQVLFEREGYRASPLEINVRGGGQAVRCALAPLPGQIRGMLAVLAGRGARVAIDGHPGSAASVPPGRHRVEVRTAQGLWSTVVAVAAGERQVVAPPQLPIPNEEGREVGRPRLGFAFLGVGVSLGLASLVTFAVGERSYERYQNARSAALDREAANPADPALGRLFARTDRLGRNIEASDAATQALLGASGAFLVSGAVLLATKAKALPPPRGGRARASKSPSSR